MRPGTTAPELKIESFSNKEWDLHKVQPDKYTLVVFYRGLHCPICKKHLQALSKNISAFKKEGVSEIIALSGDTKEKAIEAKEKWGLTDLNLGFEQSTKSMSEWGLFISKSIKDSEPHFFGEPGVFLIDKESKIFSSATCSMPFARPQIEDLLSGIKFMNENDYPRRGTISYEEALS